MLRYIKPGLTEAQERRLGEMIMNGASAAQIDAIADGLIEENSANGWNALARCVGDGPSPRHRSQVSGAR